MPWYVVTRLGLGIETDAFFASGALPQLVFLLVSSSVLPVLVPLLATENKDNLGPDAWGFFLGVTGVFSLIAAVLLVTTPYWLELIVPGFGPEARQLTTTLSRIQLLAMIGNAAIVVLWSIYYARQKFLWTELSSVFANALSLLFLVWVLPRFGIISAAWATVLNLALKIVMLMPGLGRFERPRWNSYAMTEAWRRIKPFLLGHAYSKSDPLIDRFLTSLTTAGSLSLVYIAQQIYSSVNLVSGKAIATPSVPRLAIAFKAGEWSRFRHIYRRRLAWMLAITIALALGLFVAGEPSLRLMIGHGGITAGNVHSLWWILLALSGVMIGGSCGQVISGAFYALGDTRTPTMLFIGTYTVYIPVKMVVFVRYGVTGLALATSAHLVINFLLSLVVLERSIAQTTAVQPTAGI
jgi:putative peptidoglycan lipid II flippase